MFNSNLTRVGVTTGSSMGDIKPGLHLFNLEQKAYPDAMYANQHDCVTLHGLKSIHYPVVLDALIKVDEVNVKHHSALVHCVAEAQQFVQDLLTFIPHEIGIFDPTNKEPADIREDHIEGIDYRVIFNHQTCLVRAPSDALYEDLIINALRKHTGHFRVLSIPNGLKHIEENNHVMSVAHIDLLLLELKELIPYLQGSDGIKRFYEKLIDKVFPNFIH